MLSEWSLSIFSLLCLSIAWAHLLRVTPMNSMFALMKMKMGKLKYCIVMRVNCFGKCWK